MTTYEPIAPVNQPATMPVAVPVAIPIPSLGQGESPLLLDFYSGILRRLQDAAAEGDVELIDALLASYDKPDLPEAIAENLRCFRAVARGIEFQRHVARRAAVVLCGATDGPARSAAPAAAPPSVPPLGSPLQIELRVPAADQPVRLGGRDDADPVGFSVVVKIEDEYVDGSSGYSQREKFLPLPVAFELASDAVLELPIEIDVAAGEAVRRSVSVRVDLMPGYVTVGGFRAPVQRITLGAGAWTQWPKGYEILAKTPLAALRLALARFTPENFASAYLAAQLVPAEQHREAGALLIDQLRFGRADQAQVAMAALQRMTGEPLPIGDRDAWLAWWQKQR